MKTSKYNLFWNIDEKKIAFNSATCALAEVDQNFFEIYNSIGEISYQNLSDEKKKLVDAMIEGGYVQKDHVDEIKILKYRQYRGKMSTSNLGLTIAPTLCCNFKCPYCYESPKSGMMSMDVQNAIVDLVEDSASRKQNVGITWYGGEPLIAKEIISRLSRRLIDVCDKHKVKYSSFIVTNGFLIDGETIDLLKESRVSGAQITIDGPPEVHNKRRILKNSSDGTFDTILSNVKELKKNGIRVSIRINVDKDNIGSIGELLEILEKNDLKDCPISLGHVEAYTESCASIAESCLCIEEYALENEKYRKILYEKGFEVLGYPYYPGLKANYCCADTVNSYVLDQDGFMYKCWNDLGNQKKSVMNVKNYNEPQSDVQYMNNVRFITWSPFEFNQCVECNLLPICMGGCPYNGMKNSDRPNCEKWKYGLEEAIKFTYMCKKDKTDCVSYDSCNCI